jgi:glutathione peroxidase
VLAASIVSIAVVLGAAPPKPAAPAVRPTKEAAVSLYDLSAEDIDHQTKALSAWKGKVVLVVNVASECGSTPQYTPLEKVWREYKDKGFTVLGFPSNEFGGQEPGDEAAIKKFCSTKYRVTFPMFAKIKTKAGEGQSPVYKFLTAKHPEPRWNFTKYLVGKDGQVVRAFTTDVEPDAPEVRAAIEAALKS